MEIRTNAYLPAILHAKSYTEAYQSLKEWRERDDEPKEPEGYWVERVKENERILAAEAAAVREAALKEQGRL